MPVPSIPTFLQHGLPFAYGAAFAGGFLTSLTPCVYPLIPITVSLFGARGADVPRARAVGLAALYVGGIAVMYAALGTSSALLGRAFGTFMANPWVMVALALLFAVMAASMFGAFALQLPPALQERLSRIGGRGFGGAFAMGLVGGIIAAPCTGPVLASILACVAATRSVLLGSTLLATYALGLGLLFFAIAAFAVALPKSGPWMDAVKSLFGIVMLVAALYLLRNVWPALAALGRPTASWWLGAALLAALGVALGAVHRSFHDLGLGRVRKGLGVSLTVAGLFGVVSGVLAPRPTTLTWIRGLDAGLAAARAQGKPALLDFYADWCLPCKELEHRFADPAVAAALSERVLVKVDCSSDDDQVAAARQRWGAATLPTLVLVDADGTVERRIDHVVEAAELADLLTRGPEQAAR